MIADAVALGCVSGFAGPSITNDSGTGCWLEGPGSSFFGVVTSFYWSSTTCVFCLSGPLFAWDVSLITGTVLNSDKTLTDSVWPVRGGQ